MELEGDGVLRQRQLFFEAVGASQSKMVQKEWAKDQETKRTTTRRSETSTRVSVHAKLYSVYMFCPAFKKIMTCETISQLKERSIWRSYLLLSVLP